MQVLLLILLLGSCLQFVVSQDIILQLTPEKRSVNEGDDANFTCSPLIEEAPTLLNTIDPGSAQSEAIANTDSRIKVTNIPANDSAGTTIFTWLSSSLADNGRQFFCQIGSFLSNSVTLYINYPPTIEAAEAEYFQTAGESVVLPIAVDGSPLPTLSWTLNSAIITNSSFRNLSISGLYVASLSLADARLYVVTATNGLGSASVNFTVRFMAPSPAGTRAVQDSPTSILVSWSPSSDATGYMIHYDSSGGHSGSETVSGGSTDSYLLTGLHNGDTYNISIAALSTDLPSSAVSAEFTLIPAPGQVLVSVSSITATSISLSWSVSSGSGRVASWEVVWRPTDRGSEVTSALLSGTTYTIHQLEPSTIYTLTVTATNVAGTNTSLPIIVSTVNEIIRNENVSCLCSKTSQSDISVISVAAVAVTFIVTIAVLVLSFLMVKRCIRKTATSKKTSSEPQTTTNEAYDTVREAGVNDGINEAYEAVRVVEEETNVDCKSGLETTTNMAYNTVRQIGEEADDEYEFPESIPLQYQPTTAQDSVYEQV